MNPPDWKEMPPYFVATYSGFLVVEDVPGGRTRKFTVANIRLATAFPTFDAADRAAKWAVNQIFPPDLDYFAILQVPRGPDVTEENHD